VAVKFENPEIKSYFLSVQQKREDISKRISCAKCSALSVDLWVCALCDRFYCIACRKIPKIFCFEGKSHDFETYQKGSTAFLRDTMSPFTSPNTIPREKRFISVEEGVTPSDHFSLSALKPSNSSTRKSPPPMPSSPISSPLLKGREKSSFLNLNSGSLILSPSLGPSILVSISDKISLMDRGNMNTSPKPTDSFAEMSLASSEITQVTPFMKQIGLGSKVPPVASSSCSIFSSIFKDFHH
jgi:hypothetical protein